MCDVAGMFVLKRPAMRMFLKPFSGSIPVPHSNAPFWPIVVAYRETHFDLCRNISINLAGRFGETVPAKMNGGWKRERIHTNKVTRLC
jgi:hypothetical protein